MRVLFKTLRAGPDGVVSPGQVVDLPDEEAQEAIESGSAVEAADAPPPEEEAPPEADEETATADPPENAAKPPPRRRRGGR